MNYIDAAPYEMASSGNRTNREKRTDLTLLIFSSSLEILTIRNLNDFMKLLSFVRSWIPRSSKEALAKLLYRNVISSRNLITTWYWYQCWFRHYFCVDRPPFWGGVLGGKATETCRRLAYIQFYFHVLMRLLCDKFTCAFLLLLHFH